MAGRKKNPINDILDTVGAWLGGNRGTINPQVQRTISQTKEIGKVVDQFATGGMGQALVSDAQRMAATGSSTPTELYKTAAVNLAASAVGAAAGAVVSKGVSRVKSRFVEDIGLHVSKTPGIKEITYSPTRANTGLGDIVGSPLVHGATYKVSGFPADAPLRGYTSFKLDTGEKFTNKLFPAKPKLNVGFGRYLDPESMVGSSYSAGEAQYGDTTWSMYVTKSKTGRLDPEKANRFDRITPSQNVLAEIRFPAYNKNELGKFVNARQAAQIANQRSAEVVREIQKARNVIAARQNAVAKNVAKVTGAAAFVSPKKARGGGTKKK